MTATNSARRASGYRTPTSIKLMAALGSIALLAVVVGATGAVDALLWLSDPKALSAVFQAVGPFAVVVLLAVAVVISPVPSGPIAMAAGAMYGTAEGGSLTAIGALLGAMIAFTLSRRLGYPPLCASNLTLAQWITRPRTQLRLSLTILASRLIPFISFDAVSYVAGLTAIRTRNFAAATTIGILPASFAFAAIGAGMATPDNGLLLAAACGITLVLPLGWFVARRVRSAGQVSGSNT